MNFGAFEKVSTPEFKPALPLKKIEALIYENSTYFLTFCSNFHENKG